MNGLPDLTVLMNAPEIDSFLKAIRRRSAACLSTVDAALEHIGSKA